MSGREMSRRSLLTLFGLARPASREPADVATGTVRTGAVFSLEAFYAERKQSRDAPAGAQPPPAEEPES